MRTVTGRTRTSSRPRSTECLEFERQPVEGRRCKTGSLVVGDRRAPKRDSSIASCRSAAPIANVRTRKTIPVLMNSRDSNGILSGRPPPRSPTRTMSDGSSHRFSLERDHQSRRRMLRVGTYSGNLPSIFSKVVQYLEIIVQGSILSLAVGVARHHGDKTEFKTATHSFDLLVSVTKSWEQSFWSRCRAVELEWVRIYHPSREVFSNRTTDRPSHSNMPGTMGAFRARLPGSPFTASQRRTDGAKSTRLEVNIEDHLDVVFYCDRPAHDSYRCDAEG